MTFKSPLARRHNSLKKPSVMPMASKADPKPIKGFKDLSKPDTKVVVIHGTGQGHTIFKQLG
ncbi:hypothetical protein E0H82_10360 [Acinetobacter sp. ANC 4910]|uniref:hypothetical protein n=1 Tax=Acinetobacter sp. ANC 4910 TaxID=2529850 RepID=UPI00103B6442|nr:hypothetical protein E0H82_10360 [Acinetobacter sp. ANC 4910]